MSAPVLCPVAYPVSHRRRTIPKLRKEGPQRIHLIAQNPNCGAAVPGLIKSREAITSLGTTRIQSQPS